MFVRGYSKAATNTKCTKMLKNGYVTLFFPRLPTILSHCFLALVTASQIRPCPSHIICTQLMTAEGAPFCMFSVFSRLCASLWDSCSLLAFLVFFVYRSNAEARKSIRYVSDFFSLSSCLFTLICSLFPFVRFF